MSLVLVYGDRFSGERELGQSLAEKLGYRLIDPATVIERAAAWGGSWSKLVDVLADPPGFFRLLLRRTYTQILLLRAALAEEIREGDAVCCGELADLLLHEDLPLIRVEIVASRRVRMETIRGLFGYHQEKAAAFLKKADRSRKKLLRLMCRQKRGVPTPDLVFNLEQIEFAEELDGVVAAFVRRHTEELCAEAREARLTNFALSTRVRAVLAADPATAHLELYVAADHGQVAIRGAVRAAEDPLEICRVVERACGVSDIVLNGQAQPAPAAADRAPHRPKRGWPGVRPGFLGVGTGVLGIFLLYVVTHIAGSFVGEREVPRELRASQVVQGLVTDSHCGARHARADSAQCVRECVALGGAKYVLDDGKHLYRLSNQQDADRFAGRQVRVKGVVNQKLDYIKVETMESL